MNTIEEYVVNELVELKNKNAEIAARNDRLATALDDLQDKYDELVAHLKKHLKVSKSAYNGARFISCDNIYVEYDKADFEYFVDTLGLNEEEDNDNEN